MPGFIIKSRNNEKHVDSRKEYFYSYTWDIQSLFGDTFGDTLANNNPVRIGLKECTLPTFTVNKETVEGAHIEYKFAKSVSWEDVSVTWYDVDGLYKSILSWRSSVWNADNIGLRQASEYKKTTTINSYVGSYLGDPASMPYQKYELANSWPSSIKYGDLTYTSSEVKFVSVTITYDWAVES